MPGARHHHCSTRVERAAGGVARSTAPRLLYTRRAPRQLRSRRGKTRREAGLHEASHRHCSTRVERAAGSWADSAQQHQRWRCARGKPPLLLYACSQAPLATEPTRCNETGSGAVHGTHHRPCSTRVERAVDHGADVARRNGTWDCTRHATSLLLMRVGRTAGYGANVAPPLLYGVKRAAGYGADAAQQNGRRGCARGTPPLLLKSSA